MNWASPFPEQAPTVAAQPKQKVTSTSQLDSTVDDGLSDYKPPPRPDNISKRAAATATPDYTTQVPDDTPMIAFEQPKDVLLEKINYLISLIEEQKDHRTEYVVEEMILYVFLGVFTLFVLDTFVKHGRYTR
jgi:hypothetical protein